MDKDIAIIGVSLQVADIKNIEDLEKFLEKNETAFSNLSKVRMKDITDRLGDFNAAKACYLDRIDLFDNEFFKIAPAEAERMDPEQRLMMEIAVKAVHNAGYSIKELSGQRIGIFHTFGESQYRLFFDDISNLSITSHMPGMIGTRVANFMDWRGPVIGVDTTCSSSLSALYYACQSITNGDCDMALIGGVCLNVSSKEMIKNSPIASKKQHCLPFDEDADGILAGESAIGLLIKKATNAIRDNDPIHGIIKGGAINHGGKLIQNISAPSPVSQSDVIKMAWTNSGIDPQRIGFIEAHGTGTLLGDPIEFNGLASAFAEIKKDDQQRCSISSIKAQVGHLGPLAGLFGLTKLLLSLKNKTLFPQVGFKKVNKHIDEENSKIRIQREMAYWEGDKQPRVGGVSSFGLTGTNVHMILEEYELAAPQQSIKDDNHNYMLKVGGSTQTKATRIKEYLQAYLQKHTDVNLDRFCYSVNKMLLDENQYAQIILFKNKEELELKLKCTSFNNPKETVKDQQVILLIPEILELSNLASFLAQSNDLNITYAKLKHSVSDCKIDESADRFLLQYCAIKTLGEAGFNPHDIIGGQAGKLLSLLLSEKINLREAIAKLNASTADLEPFNSSGFIQFLNSLDTTKNYTIAVMGNRGEMTKTFRQWINDNQHKKNISAVFPKPESDTCLQIISAYYEKGNKNINFDKLLNKQLFLNNLDLPLLESKRFWPTVKPLFKASNSPAKEMKDDEKNQKKELELEEIVSIVHDIWAEKLKIKSIDRTADFFDLGGSSLLGLDVLQRIENRFEANLEYADIFDYSTIISQAELIMEKLAHSNSQAVNSNLSDNNNSQPIKFDDAQRANSYDQIIRQINDIKNVSAISPANIFITGGTGFLGVFIIKDLLIKTNATIICLVRAQNDEMASERLIKKFRFYFPDFKFDVNRLKAVKGDITKSDLDLSLDAKKIVKSIDSVYHLAANVSHFGKSEFANKINAEGTVNILDWSRNNNVKNFNHFSTTAVASGYINGIESIKFYESDLDLGQNFGRNIYSNSKFKAEQYVQQHKGDLDVNIFRIGNISGDSNTGLFQHNIESNNVYERLKTLSGLGYYCEEILNHEFETTPVDIVSEMIVRLSLFKNELLNIFHIFESAPIRLTEIISEFDRCKINLQKVELAHFLEHMNQLVNDSNFSEENTIIGIFRFRGNTSPYTQFTMDQHATKAYLDKLGINYKYDISKYANTLIKYCIQKEFIKQSVELT